MITNSFIFLPGIAKKREELIWKQGVTDWNSFIEKKNINTISTQRKQFYNNFLEKTKTHLINGNSKHFSTLLPNGEKWRLYNHFKDNVCFLDIETSGYYGDITVLGLYDGYETKTMVKGFNLDPQTIKKELSKFDLIVTFNGSSFDLPVINRYYPNTIPDIPHIDLRHCCSKLNLVGGLKKIEKQLNISRADEVQDLDGSEAVYLWQRWKSTGDKKHLNLLVQYNEEDIINLKPLAEYTYKHLSAKIKHNIYNNKPIQ